ncbi:MAG: hypothetical protein M3M96_06735 [Candidatus Eremiobacteraeota bacterium]|nr:hypothetical protein [Candidatus Eremiobacteraeota bacterium]
MPQRRRVGPRSSARRGELLALRWSSVDVERRTVTMRAALSQTKAGVTVKSTKTDRVRTLPLSAFALDVLRRQKVAQAQDKLAAGGAYRDDGFVFANALGGMLSPWGATYAFAQCARDAESARRVCTTRATRPRRRCSSLASMRVPSPVSSAIAPR